MSATAALPVRGRVRAVEGVKEVEIHGGGGRSTTRRGRGGTDARGDASEQTGERQVAKD